MIDPRAPSPSFLDAGALVTAAAALRGGVGERRVTCELRFAEVPPDYGFLVMAGVEESLAALESVGLTLDELQTLRALELTTEALLARLAEGPLRVDLDAAEDGAIVFPDEPVVTLEGRLADVLIAGAVLRRTLARATAVATRTARRVLAASGVPIIDGSAALHGDRASIELVTRAAQLGGAAATTSVLGGSRLSVPVRAPVAADIAGLLHRATPAIWGASELDRLVELSAADDEQAILALRQKSPIVGGYVVKDLDVPGELGPRLDVVAIETDGAWTPRLGASADPSVDPGRKTVIRYVSDKGTPLGDILHLATERIQAARGALIIGAGGISSPQPLAAARSLPLLRALMRAGRRVGGTDTLAQATARVQAALASFPREILFLRRPARYKVGLSPGLSAQKAELLGASF